MKFNMVIKKKKIVCHFKQKGGAWLCIYMKHYKNKKTHQQLFMEVFTRINKNAYTMTNVGLYLSSFFVMRSFLDSV